MVEALPFNSRNCFDFRHLELTGTIEICATGPSPYLSPQAGRGVAGVEPFVLKLAPMRFRGDERFRLSSTVDDAFLVMRHLLFWLPRLLRPAFRGRLRRERGAR